MSHAVEPTSNKAVETLNQKNLPLTDQQQLKAAIYRPILDDLASVESILKDELQNDVPWVDVLLQHISELGGKRIRPVFLLLSGACAVDFQDGTVSQAHLHMAAALEMIHTATLIHDDVLDDAVTRRHRPTVNNKWGQKVSLLLGDYLFTHAFHVASFAESPEALRILAASSNRVCQGEMRQNHWQGNFDVTEQEYLMMIGEKTAELCGCGCRIGAVLSGASPERVDQFEKYGLDLGIAFQIIDDILDLVGNPEKVGKTLGADMDNQKVTLPLIHCLKHLSEQAREQLLSKIKNNDASRDELLMALHETGSIEYARGVAQSYSDAAYQFAMTLGKGAHAVAMQNLAIFVRRRSH